ncbi:hypothetical protein ZWY2020_001396 [Hordeum vulgare]|nr:hypothetical protein ZWY2020_001396 [Hordeum vulgare]
MPSEASYPRIRTRLRTCTCQCQYQYAAHCVSVASSSRMGWRGPCEHCSRVKPEPIAIAPAAEDRDGGDEDDDDAEGRKARRHGELYARRCRVGLPAGGRCAEWTSSCREEPACLLAC